MMTMKAIMFVYSHFATIFAYASAGDFAEDSLCRSYRGHRLTVFKLVKLLPSSKARAAACFGGALRGPPAINLFSSALNSVWLYLFLLKFSKCSSVAIRFSHPTSALFVSCIFVSPRNRLSGLHKCALAI
jgi:hypothetical protein